MDGVFFPSWDKGIHKDVVQLGPFKRIFSFIVIISVKIQIVYSRLVTVETDVIVIC